MKGMIGDVFQTDVQATFANQKTEIYNWVMRSINPGADYQYNPVYAPIVEFGTSNNKDLARKKAWGSH